MSEGYVIAIAGILLSVIGFFLVRWINSVDDTIDKLKGQVRDLSDKIEAKLATVEDLKNYAVHKNNCNHVHQEISKQIMRERCRVNDLYQRLSEGDFVKRTQRKTFSQLGDEKENSSKN